MVLTLNDVMSLARKYDVKMVMLSIVSLPGIASL